MILKLLIHADSRYDVNRDVVRATVENVLRKFKLRGKVEVGINIVGDRMMADLNRKYRNIDDSTDVLSFSLEDVTPQKTLPKERKVKVGFVKPPDRTLRLGDVIISYPQALANAAETGTSIDQEIATLIEHGLNHLLGIHHD